MSERTKYYQGTLSLADMTTEICDGSSHRDLRKAEIAKSEKQVIKTIEAIKSFNDPFDVEESCIVCPLVWQLTWKLLKMFYEQRKLEKR